MVVAVLYSAGAFSETWLISWTSFLRRPEGAVGIGGHAVLQRGGVVGEGPVHSGCVTRPRGYPPPCRSGLAAILNASTSL